MGKAGVLLLSVGALVVTGTIAGLASWQIYKEHTRILLGGLKLDHSELASEEPHGYTVSLPHSNGRTEALHGLMGKFIPEDVVKETMVEDEENLHLKWSGYGDLRISRRRQEDYAVTCWDVTWVGQDCRDAVFEDCFDMAGAHWYGGAPIKIMEWPVEKWQKDTAPYVTGDSMEHEYGGVQERYWFNTRGEALYVDWEVPLWIRLNHQGDEQLCLRATYQNSPYHNYDDSQVTLNYTTCQGDNVKEIHTYFMDNYLGKPSDIPDETLFSKPIWSTWARYGADINQSLVLEFAEEINANNYTNAQMEIDDHWELSYGRLDFDPEKFPDPKAMVDQLTAMGFRTTLWIHPFCDLASDYVWWSGVQFVFLKDPGKILPALTIWWNGVATTIDFTDPDASDWWAEHLDELQENYGISSFKFDAGESNWLPAAYTPETPFRNPSDYTTRFAEVAYAQDTEVRHQEVRVGARTQHLPMFVRMMDKDSRWSYDNGIKTVIPNALLFSILGYPFILPDMIGGNAYGGSFPDRELFIRWVELNVFLPGLQFSIAPWQYDSEVVEISRSMLELRQQHAGLLLDLARNATVTGEPIIRPLWWIAPDDSDAQPIDDEFLVGNRLLVAPVLEQGATARDVYLPAGTWKDVLGDRTLDGGQWYRAFQVQLDQLPYFLYQDQ